MSHFLYVPTPCLITPVVITPVNDLRFYHSAEKAARMAQVVPGVAGKQPGCGMVWATDYAGSMADGSRVFRLVERMGRACDLFQVVEHRP